MSMLDQQTLTDFKDKEYAHEYMEEIINTFIATQIKALREQREWTQAALAEKAEMLQPRIPILENVNNSSSLTLETLRKLARAFDLVLCVSFENFSRAFPITDRLAKEMLERTSREQDLFSAITWQTGETRKIDKTQSKILKKLRTSKFKVAESSSAPQWAREEIYAGK